MQCEGNLSARIMTALSCYGREFDYVWSLDWIRLQEAVAVMLPTSGEAVVDRLQSVSVSGRSSYWRRD